MAAQKSPLLGYNHNLKYRGRVYHVQTEDSGLDNPHVHTHLFHDGTILSTLRQDYQDLLNTPDWESQLRGRMQGQHKDMMKSLVKGSCDDKIVGFFGVLESEVEEAVPMATLPPAPSREDRQKPAPSVSPTVPAPTAPPFAPPPEAAAALAPGRPPAPSQVERQSSGVMVSMPMVIVDEPGHVPSAADAFWSQGPAAPPAPSPSAPPPPPQQTVAGANIPTESTTVPDSIFGSEIVSEKSLDEVILAYLSEDIKED